jgi:predicted Zn-dependent protease
MARSWVRSTWEERLSTDPRRAAPELEAFLKTAPKDVWLETRLANAWTTLGVRKDEALAIWRAYLPTANGPEAWTALASLGDSAALALLEAQAHGSHDDRLVWWQLASAYDRLGRPVDAREARDHVFSPGFHTELVWLVHWCLGR